MSNIIIIIVIIFRHQLFHHSVTFSVKKKSSQITNDLVCEVCLYLLDIVAPSNQNTVDPDTGQHQQHSNDHCQVMVLDVFDRWTFDVLWGEYVCFEVYRSSTERWTQLQNSWAIFIFIWIEREQVTLLLVGRQIRFS